MKFFKRTKVLCFLSGIVAAISGVFTVVELIAAKPHNLITDPSGYPAFFTLLSVFGGSLLLFIVLRCIVLDAAEDIKAAFDYASKK